MTSRFLFKYDKMHNIKKAAIITYIVFLSLYLQLYKINETS